jgi:hypothetical protein
MGLYHNIPDKDQTEAKGSDHKLKELLSRMANQPEMFHEKSNKVLTRYPILRRLAVVFLYNFIIESKHTTMPT